MTAVFYVVIQAHSLLWRSILSLQGFKVLFQRRISSQPTRPRGDCSMRPHLPACNTSRNAARMRCKRWSIVDRRLPCKQRPSPMRLTSGKLPGVMALVLPIKWSLFFAGDIIGLPLPANLLVVDGIKRGGEGILFLVLRDSPFSNSLVLWNTVLFLAGVYFFLSSLFLLSLLVNYGASSFFCILFCLVPFGSLPLFLLFLST